MKKRKLILINPVNPNRNGLTDNKSSRFPPIGLGIVAALTPQSWDVQLIDENWIPFSYEEADLVGITAFTASANRAYEIASIYHKKNVPVVMGGIHASLCTDEALEFVDSVVVGEAEDVWARVIQDFEANQLQTHYEGSWSDLKNMVPPKRDLFHPEYQFASIQTSRGCPMDCEFCSVTAFNGNRYRRRPINDVLEELKTISQKMIFFVDDNIVGYGKNSREQSIDLFKGMVDLKLNKLWFCQASLNFADDEELLYWAGKAGCKMVFIGFETEEIDTLKEVNKKLNISRGVDSYEHVFKRIQKAGIAVLGAFIFGMDNDDNLKLSNRAKYCIKSGVDVIQTTILTPLPGTRLFKNLEQNNRLLYNNFPIDWNHFDMTEVVFR
ncbi:MAG: B12-binding domain-containing radical SAM protein, partial [Bacteroidales bacterium]|nr:B12-binding domain-containing radical SAM protein [Bacteroidales bacterium]